MTKVLFAAAAVAIFLGLGEKSFAAYNYPFCRKTEGGPGDCRYDTLEQCQAALSGTPGFCQPNYWLPQTPQPAPRRRARRV